jgi:beta-lactamase regulating signal transducer with metallopeptidase domain
MMLALLLESAVRALILGFAVGCGLKLFHVQRAQIQRIVWTVVLIAALGMPWLMQWNPVTLPAPAVAPVWIASTASILPIGASQVSKPFSLDTPSAIRDWSIVPFLVYGLVATIFLLRLCIGLALTLRLVRNAERVSRPDHLDLRVSSDVLAPVTFGSTILVPHQWPAWDSVTQRAVLSHERSHLQRRDFYIQLLASVYRAIFWFNPLAWWLHSRLAELAELESDDDAVVAIGDRSRYAEILVHFANQPLRLKMNGVAMARPATITRRVERILEETAVGASLGRIKRAALVLCIIPVVALISGSCVRTHAQSGQARIIPPAAASPQPLAAQATEARGQTGRRPNRSLSLTPADESVAFALVTSDYQTFYGSLEDRQRAESLQNTINGDYIWFRQGSGRYVVTDRQTVQRAKDMLRQAEIAQRDLSLRQAQLAAEQAQLAEQQAKFGELQAGVTVRVPDLTRTLDELRARLAGTAGKELRQEEIDTLQARVGEIQALIGNLQAGAANRQAELAKAQLNLASQQVQLAQERAVFGEQQARRAEETLQQLRRMVDEIQRNGQARPVQ